MADAAGVWISDILLPARHLTEHMKTCYWLMLNMSYSSHQSIYTHFLPEMTHAGAQTLTDDVEFEMKWCERGRLSVYCSTSGKKIDVELRCCWTSWLGLSRSVTHTLSHSLGSSFSLFHLSELMNRCCRAVECRMMDCASGGRSQLGKERERESVRVSFMISQPSKTY